MLEIELKYRLDDRAAFVARLTALGCHPAEPTHDADHYLAAPDRDFKATDEVLRLRVTNGRTVTLSYKGPKAGSGVKTREELELPFVDGPDVLATTQKLFTRLGYRPVVVVEKVRTVYRVERPPFVVNVCLDEVTELGAFVEIEVVTVANQVEAAQAVVRGLAEELGLAAVVSRSYIGMLMEKRGRS